MPELGEILDGKAICICAGSGGVGKTTTSAAIAAGMAARGLKVCVLTIDPAKRLADSLGLKELDNTARLVDPALFEEQGVEIEGELWAMMLDAKATFDELIARQAPDEESRDRVLNNRIYQQISSALAYPTHSTSGFVPVRSGTRPSADSFMQNCASSAATRRSQDRASWKPAPIA